MVAFKRSRLIVHSLGGMAAKSIHRGDLFPLTPHVVFDCVNIYVYMYII